MKNKINIFSSQNNIILYYIYIYTYGLIKKKKSSKSSTESKVILEINHISIKKSKYHIRLEEK